MAPEGCLQYYTGAPTYPPAGPPGISGTISSFNWKVEDNRLDMGSPTTYSNHLANLDYR